MGICVSFAEFFNFLQFIIDNISILCYTIIVMNIYEKNSDLILEGVKDFDLRQTFDCGQCFRWEKHGTGYIGIAYQKPLYITQDCDTVTLHGTSEADWNSVWKEYFDFDRDYGAIKQSLISDDIMKQAVSFGGGIRILAQEPFECLISFIISASNNIPRIKKIIDNLCNEFGESVEYMGKTYRTFPTAERLADLNLSDLSVIRAGFRDKYILSAARAAADGTIDLNALRSATADYAKSELIKLSGVGSKVAECTMLFGLNKRASFPVDVWIKRIMEYCYFDGEHSAKETAAFAAEKFGELGGYAQQYLFYWARENKIGI